MLGSLGDAGVIHKKALRLMRHSGCPFIVELRAQVVNETKRKRKHEVLCPFILNEE